MRGKNRLKGLLDAETCGQDHAHNLRRMVQFSRLNCNSCRDYHATISYYRLTETSAWSVEQRDRLRDFVHGRIERQFTDDDRFAILIAGVADTSILAACAHTIAKRDAGLLDKTLFSIFDKCPTPLSVCSDFALRYGLEADIHVNDLTAPSRDYSVDAMVLHSVLNFIPANQHRGIIEKAVEWLKPGGELFLWNSLKRDNIRAEIAVRKYESERVHRLLDEHQIALTEDLDDFIQMLERRTRSPSGQPNAHPSPEYFENLFACIGLEPKVFEIVTETQRLPDGTVLERPYLEAIIGKS